MSVTLTTLVNFNGTDGNQPSGPLIADANGDLFGTTSSGGANNVGTVFEIANNGTVANPNYAATPTVLVSFRGGDGIDPLAGLIIGANGDLIGTANQGGASFQGSVFAIINTGTISNPNYDSNVIPNVLASFNPTTGYSPAGGLITDANGDLFGTAEQGGANSNGTVFEIKNNGTAASPNYATTPIVLASLNSSTSGTWPVGSLITDANGDLIGAANRAGANYDGAVFEIKNNGTVANPNYAATPTALVTFNGTNGASPVGSLIADANGNLFGTTENGGADDDGTVFEIKNNGTAANPNYATTPTVLVQFLGYNGARPQAGLIADANGDLFGTTSVGGSGNGVVFEIKNNGTAANPNYAATPTVVVQFNGNTNGDFPLGGLIADANGNLFGTTGNGGASFTDRGSVFEIKGSGFVVLATPTIGGTVQEGQTLTANTTSNVSSYQWQVLVGGTWSNIAGATASTFVVQPTDDGRQLRVVVADSFGNSATSAATNAVLDAAGNQSVYDSANQTTIGNGLFQYVYGTATNTTVNSGGEQNIYVGGTAIGAIINAGGVQVDWGNDSGATIDGGNQFVWGTATDAIINSGTQYVETGGTANGTTVDGGQQIVVLDGVVTNTALSGGDQYIYGATTADGTVIDAGSVQYLYSTATNTTINSGGSQNVYADATANSTTLAGGNQFVWGTASNTTISSGLQVIGSGGSAGGTTVNNGGEQDVYVGGVASGTTISGGNQSVFGGADQTTIDGGGFQYVHGSVTNTTINSGGEQNVYTDGTTTGTTLNAGGVQVDWGIDNSTTLDGGNQFVYGTATGTTVNSGTEYVGGGGTANATTINSGGTEHVWAGGTANGVTFGGSTGTLALDPGSALTGLISGFGSADTIDLGFVSFSNGTTLGYSPNTTGPAGGTLTVTDGTNVATLALLGQYSAASFALSSDGNGGTFITDPGATSQNQLAVPLHG